MKKPIFAHSSKPAEFVLRVNSLVFQGFELRKIRAHVHSDGSVFWRATLARSAWRFVSAPSMGAMSTTVVVHSYDPTEFLLRVSALTAANYEVKSYMARDLGPKGVFCRAVLVRSGWNTLVFAMKTMTNPPLGALVAAAPEEGKEEAA